MPQQRKKIFDIVPPKKIEKRRAIILPIASQEQQEKRRKGKKSFFPQRRIFFSKKVAGFFAAIFLIFFLLLGIYERLFEVRIQIHPVTEKWEFREDLTVSAGVQSVDIGTKTIPGALLEDSTELSQQFPATGKSPITGRAHGTIRVYNKYHLAQVLVANTRFLSDEGKLFRSKSRVVIPPGGFQDIEVMAAEAGEEYNIGPATFSLPGLAGSPRYTAIYGESKDPMRGGSLRESSQVTKADIEKAKEALSAVLLREGKKRILAKAQEKGDVVSFEDAIFQEVVELESLIDEGAQVEYFQVRGKANSRALIFHKKDGESFWREFISGQLPSQKAVAPGTIQEDFSFQKIDWEQKRMAIQSSATIVAYNAIDISQLQDHLKGMSVKEGITFLKNIPGVAEVDIKRWPLSIGGIPRDSNKIKILLDFQ